MKSRPHIKPYYIRALYQKAQEICSSTKIAGASDAVVCRRKDICPVLAEDARKEIAINANKLIE